MNYEFFFPGVLRKSGFDANFWTRKLRVMQVSESRFSRIASWTGVGPTDLMKHKANSF